GNIFRYVLQFHRETEVERKQHLEEAKQTLSQLGEEDLETDLHDFFPEDLKFPVRPPWDFSMSKQKLELKENRYFREYLDELQSKFSWSELSYFELNLETWRQLWRVLEMSDIVTVIVDVRFALLMFPPLLHDYIVNKLGKDVVLVLNKVDLVPAPLVVAWRHFLKEKYPDLRIVTFTSFPAYNMRGNTCNKTGLQIRRQRGKLRMAAEGAQQLLDACKDIVKDNVDLSSWQMKIMEEMTMEYEDTEIEIGETVELKKQDTSYEEHERYKGGVLTIGCIGHPNVGKSSLMNAIMGKKVVSVSRTPGHTKHFQTIFLTRNVRLCDCPGLVFPSKVPKTLQVLMGSYPIAQLREPYSTVKYLAERLDLIKMLSIQHPEQDDTWSAMDICEGWAMKKGFYTARVARPDTYRAANHLLRMALDGKISISLTPPGYTKKKGDDTFVFCYFSLPYFR
ncbi:hypothetical protein AAG570_004631, partial [Ranatra chinensis]